MVTGAKKFYQKPNGIYRTNSLQKVYQYLMAMSYMLYGHKSTKFFEEGLVYMA